MNITNLLFVAILLLVLRHRDEARALDPAPLKKQFLFFFLMMVWGFLVGQVGGGASTTLADLEVLKNCITYMLFFFLAYYAVQDARTIRFLFFVILFTAFFDIYLGLRQALDYGFNFNAARRVAAPFSWNTSDANRSSAYFTIYLCLLGVTAFYWRSSRTVRWLALGVAAFGIFVNFFTYSRQSYGILALLALILALRRNVVFALVVAIALFNYSLWMPAGAVKRIDMTISTQSAMPGTVGGTSLKQQLATNSDQRFLIWSGAAKLIEHAPWGIGLNHFTRDIGQVAPAAADQDANCYYVLSATEDSLLAPVAMLILLYGLYRLGRSVERLDDTQESKVYGISLWLAVLAIVLVNIYGSRFVDGNLMTNFWIFAGLAARHRTLALQAQARLPQAVQTLRGNRRPQGRAVLAPGRAAVRQQPL
ncbi:MAG: hypothetical protein KGJ16_09605 [Betaproteobacteria bacterium]|nr:hypothetical protein [Betaproteobacteria bacterium]